MDLLEIYFFIFDFSKQYVIIFSKIKGTMFAQMYFSVIISTFSLKKKEQKSHIIKRFISFIKYSNNITHGVGASSCQG